MSIIYLPVELINRELMARAFLSVKLAENNFKVFIFEHTFFDRNGWANHGIYIGKNCFRTEVPYSKKFYKRMKESGVNLWYLDEEGGVYNGDKDNWEAALLCRLDPKDLDFDDKILTWGKWQKKIFSLKESKAEIVISGIPNFDILDPSYQKSFLKSDLIATQGKKDYILINTRFGTGNSKIGINEVFSSNRPHSTNQPELYVEKNFITENQIMFDMIELCIFIASSLPNEQLIIRPHPTEDFKIYKILTKKIKNIHVIFSGGVEPWIRMSKMLIHNGCSTAIQAIIADKRVVTYLPPNRTKLQVEYSPGLPNTIGAISKTHEEVLTLINEFDSKSLDNTWKETVSELKSIDFILKLLEENSKNKENNINGFNSIGFRAFFSEKSRDILRKTIGSMVPRNKNNQFNYKQFSNITSMVKLANQHYKSNVKCKKITDGCYQVYK